MSKKYKRTDASHLEALKNSGVSIKAMAERFGVTAGSVHRWLDSNEAPYWTIAASRVFSSHSSKVLIIGIMDKDKWAAAEAAFKALGLSCVEQRSLG